MAKYNSETLQKYLGNRDLYGAAQYMKSVDIDNLDADKQRQFYDTLDSLERQAAKEAGYLKNLDQDGIEAYNFTQSLNGIGNRPYTHVENEGTPEEFKITNSYGDRYNNIVNNLVVSDKNNKFYGQHINSLDIEISEPYYNAFCNSLDIKDIEDNQLGLRHTRTKNGNYIISIDTDNNNLAKVLKATYGLEHYNEDIGKGMLSGGLKGSILGAMSAFIAGGGTGAIAGTTAGPIGTLIGAVIGGLAGMFLGGTGSAAGYKQPYKISGAGNGFKVDSDDFKIMTIAGGGVYRNDERLRNLVKVVDDATNKANLDQETVGNQEVTDELIVSQYFGAGDAKLQEMYQNGKLDRVTYNSLRKERFDKYSNLLAQADFTQYEVYSINDGDFDEDKGRTMTKIEKSSERANLKDIVDMAMQDGRVIFNTGAAGGKLGTVITILPKADKGEYSSKTAYKGQRIFVPDLFQSTAEESLKADTKFMAQADYGDMKHWNYGKRLHTGEYVGYSEEIGPYVIKKSDDGKDVKIPVSDSEVLHKLNEQNIISVGVRATLNDLKTSESSEHADAYAKVFAMAAIEELYPNTSHSERERIKCFNEIYKLIIDLSKVNKIDQTKVSYER